MDFISEKDMYPMGAAHENLVSKIRGHQELINVEYGEIQRSPEDQTISFEVREFWGDVQKPDHILTYEISIKQKSSL